MYQLELFNTELRVMFFFYDLDEATDRARDWQGMGEVTLSGPWDNDRFEKEYKDGRN